MNITDINACYKTIDQNIVSLIFEIKKASIDSYEEIFRYTFSIDDNSKNSIEMYKDLPLKDLLDVYNMVKNNPNYKGIFDIYFKVYQNDIEGLKSIAINNMNEVNNPQPKEKESIFNNIKNNTKNLFKEMWEKGSTNKLNGTITRVAAYKKECPEEKIGEFANRLSIDIIRYGTDAWENIYSYEYGKYKMNGILTDVDSVSVYKVLTEEEIFKVISLVSSDTECEVITKYLKTTPKYPTGNATKYEKEQNIENIKFL